MLVLDEQLSSLSLITLPHQSAADGEGIASYARDRQLLHLS